MYLFAQIDSSIMLTNNKKALQDKSWGQVRTVLNGCGKVVQMIRKMRDHVENMPLKEPHY